MKAIKLKFFLPLLALFFWSCSGDEDIEPKPLQQFKIAQSFLASNELIPQQNLLITTSEEWEELKHQMQQVRGNVLEDFTETSIDFDEFQVIAIFDKVRPHTGFYIKAARIEETWESLEVSIETGNTEAGYTMLTQPFYILKIQKTNKQITFKE